MSRASISASKDTDIHTFSVGGKQIEIRNVWADTLEEEMETVRLLAEKYKYVAMDTEFPGVVARPVGAYPGTSEYQFQMMRCNVEALTLIQLGISFVDDNGEIPDKCPCFQFNFRFSLEKHVYAPSSIQLLKDAGLNFDDHRERGIEPDAFAELLMSSGLVLCDDIKWITFHSGYDFGYLLRMLTCQQLPGSEKEFMNLVHTYFPVVYDVKHLMSIRDLKGGLQKLADDFQIPRIGTMHQAGSDALLTSAAFFKLRQKYFNGEIENTHAGVIHGYIS